MEHRPDPVDWRLVDDRTCTIRRALDIVGDRWTLLILRDAMRGVRRFDDYAEHVGVSRAVLADRLRTLVANGIMERTEYREPGQRTRAEYGLTRKGWDLHAVLTGLLDWGDRHLGDPEGPTVTVNHRACGGVVHVAVDCGCGAHELGPGELELRSGPGARRRPATGRS